MKTFNALSEEVTQKQLNDVEKFADRILAKFNVDIEFTRHFADRMNDDRNKPAVSVTELQQIFKKIARKKAKDIRQNPDSEAVIKDIQKDLNLPVVIRYNRNKEEFEVTTKTIMRKKDFKTTSKVITTEAKKMKDDPCWKDYEMVGTKKKNGKEVPNCVPKEDVSLESTKEYGKSQAAIARKRQQAAMRPGEMDKLKRLKDMLKNANNKVGVVKKESVDEATIEEAVQDWTVTVTKPVNKLKKGATQKVKARSAFEAINKAVKLWGDPALKAAPMNSFSITKESVELDEAAGKYSKSGDNLMYKWGDVNKALMNAGLNPRVILNVLAGLSKKEVKESVELDEGYQNKVLASKGQWVFQNKGEIQQIKYKGKVIGDGYYDRGSDSFDVSWTDFKRGQKNNRKGGTMFDTAQDVVDFFSKMKITESVELDEATGKLNAKGEIEMTAKNYAKVHKDYKTKMQGVPYAMQIDPKTGGSALYPVKIIKESVELDEATATTKQKKSLASLMTKALGGKKSKPGYTSSIASNGDFVAYDDSMRIQGRIKKGDFTDPMTEARQMKDPKKDSMVTKSGKTIVIDKSKESEYLKKGWTLAENETVKESNNFFKFRESLNEKKDSAADLYFDTYSAAVQHAKAQAEKKGFEVVEDDWFTQVTTGKGKPGRGKTTRHTLKLLKNDKPVRKSLAIQVYNRDTNKNTYELNMYIS